MLVLFGTKPRDWLGRTSPKWPILQGEVGRKKLVVITNLRTAHKAESAVCVCQTLYCLFNDETTFLNLFESAKLLRCIIHDSHFIFSVKTI